MRLLHTFDDQKTATHFSSFLTKEGIDNQCEVVANTDWGSSDYGTLKCHIWVIDEDQLAIAQKWIEEYLQNPTNPLFQDTSKWHMPFQEVPASPSESLKPPPQMIPPKKPPENKNLGIITMYLLMICTLIFLYGEFTSPTIQYPVAQLPAIPLYSPTINKGLYYDYPQAYEIIDKLVNAYGYQKLQNLSDLPREGKVLLQKFEQTPYWTGFYDKLVEHFTKPEKGWNFNAPLFEKIKQGEIWRLVTPCLLHLNVFHLFFNMIWLVVLGKMIEEKIGALRYLILILIVAVISNTAQYLMSGSNFIGISGVICGMLGFVWARQHVAAWEGYNLQPGVISFMFFFIFTMFAIQLVSFFLQAFYNINFMPSIANTAHLIGGLTGYLIGRLDAYAITMKKN